MTVTTSKSFTAVADGPDILVRNGESFTYDVSGTFVGTVSVIHSDDGGVAWAEDVSATGAASGTIIAASKNASHTRYRFRCSAFTSGTIVTALATVNDVVPEGQVRNREGDVLMSFQDDGLAGLVRKSVKRITNAAGQAKAGTTSGWIVAVADNIGLVTCPASKTASTLVVPINGLKVGDTITGFHLIGQIESGGNTATVDADLRKHTAAAADVADASVGAMTQLAVTADAIMSASNTAKTGLSDTVGADETFYVLITVTTAAATDIALQGVAITVDEA